MAGADAPEQEGIAILGAGNIGRALALGWVAAGLRCARRITLTRRRTEWLADLAQQGFCTTSDNVAAVRASATIVLAVQPTQLRTLAEEIGSALDPERHMVISLVSGVRLAELREMLGAEVSILRAMPNTGLAIRESMTCLAGDSEDELDRARALFDTVGKTMVIHEDLMVSATALCACGIAFFLRAIRAASQGGIEIGFHPEEAIMLAAQTAKGAAALMLSGAAHPEAEIDRVTTPRGCTITGLNEMEHRGFSSAFIKAILASANKARDLAPPRTG